MCRALLFLLLLTLSAFGQKMQNSAGEAPGPWILGNIGVGKQPDGSLTTTATKGLAIKVGEQGEAAVAYDLDLCRLAGAWTGKFTTPMNLMSRGEFPTALGEVAFTSGEVSSFTSDAAAGAWKDPRAEPFGPLPPGQARFRGFHVAGDQTVLEWQIGSTRVLEMPSYAGGVFTRIFSLPATAAPLFIAVARLPADTQASDFLVEDGAYWKEGAQDLAALWDTNDDTSVCFWRRHSGNLFLEIPKLLKPTTVSFQIAASRSGKPPGREVFEIPRQKLVRRVALEPLLAGGKPHWPEVVTTAGDVSLKKEEAYVVDTIKLPDPNPWNAPMFLGGLDFFPDGRAAVCTFHGDVFIVSGLDESLEHVTWKRFASGLYHALGLKIVGGDIYVTCRDGLWRLKDLNGDSEADSYEAFNFDLKASKNFHEFVFDLQTDPAGNFYFAKAGPVKNGGRGFDAIMAHHGCLFRVSPDGQKLDIVATGFRAPNGIGVGPQGQITSGDNEGTWTPVCRLNWIQQGGFYGVPPLAHRDTLPTSYDPPLCWMPKRVDNSSGGQVWVPDDERWGPWRGQMLHLSYGTCSLLGVLKEEVETPQGRVMQGGVTRFPLQFQSGVMRGRFNPHDGQLYVCGLRGWQTTGLKNGCLQRVRYTGGVPRMPLEMHVTKAGIALRFACSLDTQSARDPENWHLEQWRYLWTGAYGSPDLSTEGESVAPAEQGKDGAAQFTKAQMNQAKHDPVTVRSVQIGTDDRSVFLEIPGIKPVMQMSIKYDLKTSSGEELRGEVVNTINGLGK